MIATDNPRSNEATSHPQQPPTLLGGAMDMWRRRRLSLSGTPTPEETPAPLNNNNNNNKSSNDTITTNNNKQPQNEEVEVLRLTLRGVDLVEMPVVSLGIDGYRVAANRCVSIGKFQPGVVSASPFVDVCTSKVVPFDQSPVWEEMTLTVNDLCGVGGDLDSPILISVHEHESKEKGKHLMGSCQTTVRELVKSCPSKGNISTTDMNLIHHGRALGKVAVVWAELGTLGGNNEASAAVPENNWLSRTLNLAAGLINSVNSHEGENEQSSPFDDHNDSEEESESDSEDESNYDDDREVDEDDHNNVKEATKATQAYPVARITRPLQYDDDDDDSQSTYSSDSDSDSDSDDEITVADVLSMAEESMRGATTREHREGLQEIVQMLSPKRGLRSASNILQEMPEWDLDGDSVVGNQPQPTQQQQQQRTTHDDDVSVADLYLDESVHTPTANNMPPKQGRTPGLSAFMNTSNQRRFNEAMMTRNEDLAKDDDTVLLRQQVALSIEANRQKTTSSKRSARRRAKRTVQKTLKSIYGILKENLKEKSTPLNSIPENNSQTEEEEQIEDEIFDWAAHSRRMSNEKAQEVGVTQEMGGASPDGNVEEAVHRLAQLGFDHATAKKAFLASGKNEMAAANLLMDGYDNEKPGTTDEKRRQGKETGPRQNSPQPKRRPQRKPSRSRSGSKKDTRSLSPSRSTARPRSHRRNDDSSLSSEREPTPVRRSQQSPPKSTSITKSKRVAGLKKSLGDGHHNLEKLGLGLAAKLIGENKQPAKERKERSLRGRRSSFSGGSSRSEETTSTPIKSSAASSDALWLDDTPVDYLAFHGLSETDAQTVVDAVGIRTMEDFAFFDEEMLKGLVEATGLEAATANKLSIAIHVFHTCGSEKRGISRSNSSSKKKGTRKLALNAAVKVAKGAKAAGKGATKLGATAARSTVKVTKTVAKGTVHVGKAAAARSGRVAQHHHHHHHQMKPSCLAEQEGSNLGMETLPSLNIY